MKKLSDTRGGLLSRERRRYQLRVPVRRRPASTRGPQYPPGRDAATLAFRACRRPRRCTRAVPVPDGRTLSQVGEEDRISRAADSALSEPCTRFSLRLEWPGPPGSCPEPPTPGWSHPSGCARPARCPRALDHQQHHRRPGDEYQQIVVEALSLVLRVVAASGRSARAVRSSAATSRSPLRSRRAMISPTRPRSTASGLQMTRVRFTSAAP